MENDNDTVGAKSLTRRAFLRKTAASALWFTSSGFSISSPAVTKPNQNSETLRFGVIADVHHNFAPDAYERLLAFIEEMNRHNVGFVVQLGDFCHGYTKEDAPTYSGFLALWNSFKGPRYHVLGNHEMDRCVKTEVMDFWGMDRNTYSYDLGGYHFVVLDTNYLRSGDTYKDYDKGNYFGADIPYLSPNQLDWLKCDLAAAHSPTLIFSHYGFYHDSGVKNRATVRSVLEQANANAGFQKVIACFCGHYHLDGVNTVNGIHYIQINSSSYYWLGGEWKWAPYKDPLYATVALKRGLIEIKGKKSEFVGPPPWERGFPRQPDRDITAKIADRSLRFRPRPKSQAAPTPSAE